MSYLWLALAGGAMGFAHCMGMCGPIAAHLGQQGSAASLLGRQLLWHAGKTTTYMFLGALAGFAGSVATSALPAVQDWAAYVAGGLMIIMGLGMLGLLPKLRRAGGDGQGLLWGALRQLLARPTGAGALVLGLATGFLPCPLVMGFLALSAAGGSVAGGIATMAAMGVGTMWSLLLVAFTGRLAAHGLRRWGPVLAGVVLLAAGAATMARGTDAFHQLLGCGGHGGGGACCHGGAAAQSQPSCTHCSQRPTSSAPAGACCKAAAASPAPACHSAAPASAPACCCHGESAATP
jgi:sulfite exporter TauE/SafE